MAALVVNLPRPTTTLRLNNMLTAADLEDESSFGDIEEETKVSWLQCLVFCLALCADRDRAKVKCCLVFLGAGSSLGSPLIFCIFYNVSYMPPACA